MGLFSKIKEGLRKTKESMISGMQRVVNSFTKIDEDLTSTFLPLAVTALPSAKSESSRLFVTLVR